MRRVLAALAVLLAVPVGAQTPSSVVGPGTRVRVFLSSEDLPREGVQFVGALRSVGDTLVIATDGGSVIRVLPRDLAGFDVSAGREGFPVWLPFVGGVAGLGGALGVAPSLSNFTCANGFMCEERRNNLQYGFILLAGTTLGVLAGAYVGSRFASERWVPAGRLAVAGPGVSWTVRL